MHGGWNQFSKWQAGRQADSLEIIESIEEQHAERILLLTERGSTLWQVLEVQPQCQLGPGASQLPGRCPGDAARSGGGEALRLISAFCPGPQPN